MSVSFSSSPAPCCSIASIEIPASASVARDVREHADLILDAHAQVVRRLDLGHRQYADVAERVGLERQVRNALLGLRAHQTGHLDDVGQDGGGGRLRAGAGAVVHRDAGSVALTRIAFIAPSTLAMMRSAGISVGWTRSSIPPGRARASCRAA